MRFPKASTSARSLSSIRRVNGRWPDFESPFCAGPVLVDPAYRSVDHHIFEIWIVRERLEHAFPHALLRPPPEARVDGRTICRIRLADRARENQCEQSTKPPPQTIDCSSRFVPDRSIFPAIPLQCAHIVRRSDMSESKLASFFASLESNFPLRRNPDCKQALVQQRK